jgi:hypothetical protein
VKLKPFDVALAGASVAFIFALSACSQSEPPTVASAVGPSGTPAASVTAGTSALATYIESQRAWAKCMRDAGFEISDPDAKGEVKFGGNLGKLKADPKFTAAQKSCNPLLLPVPAELIEKEQLTAQQIVARRAYAKCMRDSGVPAFPDPAADGSWPMNSQPAMTEQQAAAQYRAGQICEPLLDGMPSGSPNPNASARG